MSDPHPTRQQRVIEQVQASGADALLVTHLPNIRWLTGFSGTAALSSLFAGASGRPQILSTFSLYQLSVMLSTSARFRAVSACANVSLLGCASAVAGASRP